MTLKVDDLQMFALVVQEGSLSRAADTLNIGQRSLCERLRSLEHQVGRTLLVRADGGMQPTPVGYRLLPYAQRCLTLLGEALDVARDEQDDALRIGIHETCTQAARPVLEQALLCFPIAISVHTGSVDDLVERVARRELDLAIGPINDHPPEVDVESLLSDPLVCVTAPGSDLAGVDGIRLADLAGQLLSIDVWGLADPAFAEVLLGPRPHQETPSGRHHHPVRVCCRSMVATQIAAGDQVELHLVDLPCWVVQVRMAFRSADADSEAMRALLDAVAEERNP
jgi:DNA-binding transcriptional LysR family regulator